MSELLEHIKCDVELRCIYCAQLIQADNDAQRVSKREYAHTVCAFAASDAFFVMLDAESERE